VLAPKLPPSSCTRPHDPPTRRRSCARPLQWTVLPACLIMYTPPAIMPSVWFFYHKHIATSYSIHFFLRQPHPLHSSPCS
jgi:hypothetical protein